MIKASVWDVVSAVSLLISGALALGYLVSLLVLKKHDPLKALFGCFAVGLLLLNTYLLLGGTLSSMPLLLGVATAAGVGAAIWHRRFRGARYRLSAWHLAALAGFVGLGVWVNWHVLERIAYEPVYQWDAKVMWQLRTKQLFLTNGLTDQTGFADTINASDYNPHPTYPTLLPMLGAYVATYVGFWNEFIPKANLLILFAGLLIGLCSARALHWTWKLVVLVLMMGFNPYMMSIGYSPLVLTLGYVDGWLSIYSGLTLLWLALYVRQGSKEYLFNALATGTLLATMKNEGLVMFLLLFGIFALTTLAFNLRQRSRLLFRAKRLLSLWPVLLIGLLPTALWSRYKAKWGSGGDDYDFSRLFKPDQYATVFNDAKLALIRQEYTERTLSSGFWKFYALVLVAAVAYLLVLRLNRRVLGRIAHEWTLSALSGVAFVALMNVVYCASIRDISWHLSTSADRLGIHSYYLFGIGLITLGTVLHYLPYRRQQPTPAMAPQPTAQAKSTPVSHGSTPKTKPVSGSKKTLAKR